MVQAGNFSPQKYIAPAFSDFSSRFNSAESGGPLPYGEALVLSKGTPLAESHYARFQPTLAKSIATTLQARGVLATSDFALVYKEKNGRTNIVTSSSLGPRVDDGSCVPFVDHFETLVAGGRSGNCVRPQGLENVRRIREATRAAKGPHNALAQRSGTGSRHRKFRVSANRQPQPQYDSDSQAYEEEEEECCPKAPQTVTTERVRIGDEEACRAFYEKRFHRIQQVPCKQIAKDWIKAIEPKKQTAYPYNGGKQAKELRKIWEAGERDEYYDVELEGNVTKPPWWPKDVKHREPDHINKKERLALLDHLLTKLFDPPHHVRVDTLRQSTKRTMAGFRDIKGGPGAKLLTEWLNEIYDLREYQEMAKLGMIDETATLTIRALLPEPRRTPKKQPDRSQAFTRQRQVTSGTSDVEQSNDDSPIMENESPSSLTSPVGKMDVEDGSSMVRRNTYRAGTNLNLDHRPQQYHRGVNPMTSVHPTGIGLPFQNEIQSIETPLSAPINLNYSQEMLLESDSGVALHGNFQSDAQLKRNGTGVPAQPAGILDTAQMPENVPVQGFAYRRSHGNAADQHSLQAGRTGPGSNSMSGQYLDFWNSSHSGCNTQTGEGLLHYTNADCGTSSVPQLHMATSMQPAFSGGQMPEYYASDCRANAAQIPMQRSYQPQTMTPVNETALGLPVSTCIDRRQFGYPAGKV